MVDVPSEDGLGSGLDRTTTDEGVVNRPAYNPLRSGIGYGRTVVFGIEDDGLEPISDLVKKDQSLFATHSLVAGQPRQCGVHFG
jgi:hypothetical protein